MKAWKQLRAILLLPGTITVFVPATILHRVGIGRPSLPWNVALPIGGSIFILLGLTLMVWTNCLFTTVGQGTLAPWDPPRRLVVRGVYRHVRNPMMAGVFCILLGEAVCFGSWPLLGWFGVVAAAVLLYIPLVEERGLKDRFGDDYRQYLRNVPRWIPRWSAWEGLPEPEG